MSIIISLGLYWCNCVYLEKDKYIFGNARVISIKKFLKSLPSEEILEAIDLAHDRIPSTNDNDFKTWKYFCGICWNKIKRLGGGPDAK